MPNKIELTENDGYMYDDGNPEIFIFRVNGKPFPVKRDVTIGEFYKRVSGINISPDVAIADLDLKRDQENHAKAMSEEMQRLAIATESNRTNKNIERCDIIRCLRIPEELADPTGKGKGMETAVPGKEYLVQGFASKNGVLLGYHATPLNSDWPQMVTIRAQDAELVRKRVKEDIVIENKIQTIVKCTNEKCLNDTALTLLDDKSQYQGMCEKCSTIIICKREEVPCVCGEKNFLMLYKDHFIGRCKGVDEKGKECGKEQRIPADGALSSNV